MSSPAIAGRAVARRARGRGPAAVVALALAVAAPLGCSTAIEAHARPASPWEQRYRELRDTQDGRALVTTRLYRGLVGRAIYSDCHMVPHDSAAFDQRLARCNAVSAVMVSFSRLLLEAAATPAFLTPIVRGGHVRWLDPVTSCGP